MILLTTLTLGIDPVIGGWSHIPMPYTGASLYDPPIVSIPVTTITPPVVRWYYVTVSLSGVTILPIILHTIPLLIKSSSPGILLDITHASTPYSNTCWKTTLNILTEAVGVHPSIFSIHTKLSCILMALQMFTWTIFHTDYEAINSLPSYHKYSNFSGSFSCTVNSTPSSLHALSSAIFCCWKSALTFTCKFAYTVSILAVKVQI